MNKVLKFSFLIVGLLALSAPAFAQTYSKVESDSSGNFTHRTGTLSSPTVPAFDSVTDTGSAHAVALTSSGAQMTAVVTFALNDGTVISTTTATISATAGPTVIKTAAPLFYQKFKVSPTTALSNDTLKVDSIRSK